MTEKMEKEEREEQAEEALRSASPVPESFEQAVSLACSSVLEAAQAGSMRQTIFFDAGGAESSTVSGEIGNCIAFAEQFARTLAGSEALEGGKVTLLATDMGAAAMCSNIWGDLPPNLEVQHLPNVLPGKDSIGARREMERFLDSEVIILLVPSQGEMPAMFQLAKMLREEGADKPMVLLNSQLTAGSTVGMAGGIITKSYNELQRSFVQTFHLQQCDMSEEEDSLINEAVVTRVWPRPFSLWEDNPEDPEAVNGFFLLDLDDAKPQDRLFIKKMLKASQALAKKMMELKAKGTLPRRST